MKRLNVGVTDRQYQELDAIVKGRGLTLSELVRRILDDWLDRLHAETETLPAKRRARTDPERYERR